MRLFISHSSADLTVVEAVVDLIRAALPIAPHDLRCTSLEGYRLPGGVSVDERLRQEIHDAQSFVGLVSHRSLRSTYVVFELGARWGAGRHLVPLLAPGVPASVLEAPLSTLNTLSCDSRAQLHQLIADLATTLGIEAHAPAAYQRQIERLVGLPPATPEPRIPDALAGELRLTWPARRERLTSTQKQLLDFITAESRRRRSIPQQVLESEFDGLRPSIYWRLETLCLLGFVEKEVTDFHGDMPRFNYRLTDDYAASIAQA